jgi:hypothetical protein
LFSGGFLIMAYSGLAEGLAWFENRNRLAYHFFSVTANCFVHVITMEQNRCIQQICPAKSNSTNSAKSSQFQPQAMHNSGCLPRKFIGSTDVLKSL